MRNVCVWLMYLATHQKFSAIVNLGVIVSCIIATATMDTGRGWPIATALWCLADSIHEGKVIWLEKRLAEKEDA
jgi:hypothetical protein